MPAGEETGGAGRSALSRLERLGTDLGAVAIVLIGLYVALGIVLRTFFNAALPDQTVLVGEAMVVAVVLPLAHVAATGSFIAVDAFTGFAMRSRAGRAILAALTAAVGLFAAGIILVASWGSLHDAVTEGNYFFGVLSWPEWPGRLAFFLGYVLFALRLTLLLAGSFRRGAD